MNARATLIALFLAAAAPRAGAQQAASDTLDSASATQIAQIVSGAQAQGLPTERIVAKVKRGLLIHTPSPRIVAAARAVADRLELARAALAPSPAAADIEAGEDALSLGIRADALKSLREVSPNQSIAVPLGVLAQLVASGVSPKRATDMVEQLIRRGATNVQLVALGNDVDSDVGRGARADASLDARMNGLTAILAPGAAADAITAGSAPTPRGPKKP